MATDIASSVIAEYTAVIQAPDDTDAADAAAFVNLVLPIANRVEFLNAQLNDAPWVNANVFDDFKTVTDGGEFDNWQCDTQWEINHSGSTGQFNPTILVSTSDAVGILRLSHPAAQVDGFRMRTALTYQAGQTQRVTARLRLTDAGLASQQVSVGVGDGFNNGIGSDNRTVRLLCNAGADWVLETNDNVSTSTVAIVGSAPSDGVFQQLDLFHDGAGTWTASVDGGAAVTAVANIPALTDDMALILRYEVPNAGTRELDIDFIHGRFLAAGRVI